VSASRPLFFRDRSSIRMFFRKSSSFPEYFPLPLSPSVLFFFTLYEPLGFFSAPPLSIWASSYRPPQTLCSSPVLDFFLEVLLTILGFRPGSLLLSFLPPCARALGVVKTIFSRSNPLGYCTLEFPRYISSEPLEILPRCFHPYCEYFNSHGPSSIEYAYVIP